MDLSEFKYKVWDNTRKIGELMNTILNRWGSEYGLSALQLRILMELHQNGPQTVGGLAGSVLISGANISTMCKKLESMGFVVRTRDSSDERVVLIALSEKGGQIIKTIDRYYEEAIASEMGEDGEKNLEAIICGMEKINELLHLLADDNDD